MSADTVDNLMRKAYTCVFREGHDISPSRGDAKDLFGVLLELQNPRARVSRSQARQRVFSALGELLWYLSGSDDAAYIGYYVDYYNKPAVSVDGHVTGAYGPRLLRFDGVNQIQAVVQMLRANPDSRNAVVQIFDHEDTDNAPCTLALQFAVREHSLVLMTSMRSNDLYLGLPHDIFAFTMLQEIVARSIDVEVGVYLHSVGSFHLYKNDISAARSYLAEGWQDRAVMPAMPLGDPWPYIKELLVIEEAIRTSKELNVNLLDLPEVSYWRDLAILLCTLKLLLEKRTPEIIELAEQLDSKYFRDIVLERIDKQEWARARNDLQR
ncbi:UNVERIFIED_CONTAM: thymidylate synthase [Actinomycetes bacterium ARC8]|nr:thymidylate synthase [Actinomycetes bacterium ARC8]